MKKTLFILFLLLGTVSSSGNIPILYLTSNGNYRDYCIDGQSCIYKIEPIKQEKNIWTILIPIITIIAFSLILLYLFVNKISDLNGYKKIIHF